MYNVQERNKESLVRHNELLGELLREGEPFSSIRVGNMEGYFLECFYKREMPLNEFFYWLSLTSGVFPENVDYLVKVWAPIMVNAMISADCLSFVDVSGEIEKNEPFKRDLARCPSFYGVDNILPMDPGFLINKGLVNVECNDPWTRYLAGKKVLVVSSMVESIKQQWDKRHLIWGDKVNDIIPFDLVGVIRSPFHPLTDKRQDPSWTSWDKVVDNLKRQMDEHDYDVCLISSASTAPALADHAKVRRKVGITVCGSLQLFFGIIGNRWAGGNAAYTGWTSMFNEHWVEPNPIDLPSNVELFNRFEKAYWK